MKSDQGKSAVTSPVKSKPVPNDDFSKVLTPSKKLKTKPNAKSTTKREYPKLKPKLTSDAQLDPSKLTLSKKGKTGEWHIEGYAQLHANSHGTAIRCSTNTIKNLTPDSM